MDIRAKVEQAVREALGENISPAKIAPMIDHTILKPEAKASEVDVLCEEARRFVFASVCVNPCHVSRAAKLLAGSSVKVCTVIGFPLGASTTATKVFETEDAIKNGATEIDMVLNIGALKDRNWDLVMEDIRAVADASHEGGAILKVILETCLLNDEEKVAACTLSKEAGADFVKTSTGFSKSGATVEDIRLMRQTVGPKLGVKASGGIRDTATAAAMIKAGATRIGASASIAIVSGEK